MAEASSVEGDIWWASTSAVGQLRKSTGPPGRSAAGGEADVIGAKADVASAMSEAGGKADVPARWLESLLLAEAVEKLP